MPWRRSFRAALAQPGRLMRTAAAVALAVSLVAGTFTLTDTIDSAFHRAATSSQDDIDLVVRATSDFTSEASVLPERQYLPEALLDTVKSVPGVGRAWGEVLGYAQLVDKDGQAIDARGLPTVGTAWSPGGELVAGRAPSGAGEVVIDEATARADGLQLGDQIKVMLEGVVQEFTIAGLRKVSDLLASTQATFDLQTAQRLLGQLGSFDAIPVKAGPGVDPQSLRVRIGEVLPDRYEVVTFAQSARETEDSWTQALSFLTTALLILAAVALMVGAFIIFNTFSILVAQRTRELGLLRAMGASRSQVTRSVLAEALAVGLVASVAGVALGYVAARGLLALLRNFGFDLPAGGVSFRPSTMVVALGCGVAVTVAAAVVPARRATRVSPVTALAGDSGSASDEREDDDIATPGRRAGAGALVGAAGVCSLGIGLLGAFEPPVVPLALGVGGVLIGVAMLVPLVARPAARVLGAPLARFSNQPGLLARENAMRNPRRTASTAAALMIGITLVGVVATMAASMKASARQAVAQTMSADFAITAKGLSVGSGGVPTAVAEKLRKTKSVAAVSEIRGGQFGLDGKAKSLVAVDPKTVTSMYDLDAPTRVAVEELDDKSVLVRQSVAAKHGWEIGDKVPMTFARSGSRDMRLAGTFSVTAVRSDYVISLKAHKANYTDTMNVEVDVLLKDGTTEAGGRVAVQKALADFPNVEARNAAEVVAAQSDKVNKLLLPIIAVLALSVVIALLGIVNTLALSISERTRELGLLRAVGMAQGQLRAMVRNEALIIALLGSLLGVFLSTFLGWALVKSLHDLGVTEMVFPTGQLIVLVVVATAAGVAAGVIPARRAGRLDVLEAVAAD